MAKRWLGLRVAGGALLVGLSWAVPAGAFGESSADGFPNWAERVMHEWMNRARSAPQTEMTTCGAPCGEKACYTPIGPVWYSPQLNRAARFHAEEMVQQAYFAHDSACTVVPNISSIYPATCNGAASCACVGGTKACSPTCTAWSARVKLFGPSASGEIIASSTDPNSAFYQWLYENSAATACQYSSSNGHRWLILKSTGSVGTGSAGRSVGDFSGGGTAYKIPSGSHYPRQAASIDVWANWYDTAAPSAARVNVDGACTSMTLGRGTQLNGAWTAKIAGMGSGCHRYYFVFRDSGNQEVTYPSTGSLGIGPAASCADWNSTRPAMGAGCACVPSCAGKQCGPDGCGGSCGTCASGQSCQGSTCVSGSGGAGGSGGTSSGGSGGSATGGTSSGGTSSGGTGGIATGGSGGGGGSGGVATGGTGGVATGGSGGGATGGSGGVATGGTGGAASGGTTSGGAGGASSGGNAGQSGGAAGSAGVAGTAGAVTAGGAAGAAGSTSSGGAATGGKPGSGGSGLSDAGPGGKGGSGSGDDSGCGCRVPGRARDSSHALGALALLGLLLVRRRRSA
ncbi:MAG: hypothetical protein IPI67_15575 [Myxococcales bacterium]|nr:hypothetical protein [Myxococcales bacterium]